MQAELSRLAAGLGLSGIGRAGLGPYFMMLGLALLGDEGRIGLVVPRSMLSGVSWKKIRAHYLDQCEITYIVSNFDPARRATRSSRRTGASTPRSAKC